MAGHTPTELVYYMTENPFQSPPPLSTEVENEADSLSQTSAFRWSPILFSAVAWFVAYLGGSDAASSTAPSPAFFMFLLAIISSIWLYRDAKRLKIKLAGSVSFLVFFCWMFAVPIFLIYTRGIIGWLWAFLQAAGLWGAWYIGSQVYN